jgi:hypothetical protein
VFFLGKGLKKRLFFLLALLLALPLPVLQSFSSELQKQSPCRSAFAFLLLLLPGIEVSEGRSLLLALAKRPS